MTDLDARATQTIAQFLDADIDLASRLKAEFEPMAIRGGDWLFRQGDDGDALYILVRGRLQVWLETEGSQRRLGDVVPGEVLGEIGLLTGETRTAGLRAARDSALLRLDRSAFERLAQQHPQFVVRMAAQIARRLHQRTSSAPGAARSLVNICVVPLDETERSRDFCAALTHALRSHGSVIALERERLGAAGAPVAGLASDEDVPAQLGAWLDECEDRHRFVLYKCDVGATSWSRYAVRQADLVLLVGDAAHAPARRDWEVELLADRDTGAAKRSIVLLQPAPPTAIAGTAQWLADRALDYHLHVREGEPRDLARVARVLAGCAVGLVLGSGAARGIAHIGVFKALHEAGIDVDWVGGASIGGIFAVGIAHDWKPDEMIARLRRSVVDSKPFGDYTLPMFALLRGNRVAKAIAPYAETCIEDLPLPFFCVSSNLEDATMNVHESGPLGAAVLAGAALPGILPPRIVNGRLAVDGGVLNALPVDLMRDRPVGTVIAVDLSSRKSYRLDYAELPSPWMLLLSRILPFGRRYRLPVLITLLLKSSEIGTMEKVQRLGAEADLLLRPPVRSFGMTQVKAFDAMVEVGYRHTLEELARWRAAAPNSAEVVNREAVDHHVENVVHDDH